ncbi:MAG: vitamin-B12 independent methionine synthase [Candidatus Tectimicrobiota bacterium]
MPAMPLFPVTVVGSLPRSSPLLAALRRKQAGRLEAEEFAAIAAQAVREAVRLQEQAGVDMLSDGEQQRDNFYSFIVEHVDGVRLMSLAEMLDYVENKAAFERLLNALDVPAFAIKNPVVTGPVRRREALALAEYQAARSCTDRPIKIALPGPYLLTRSMWVKSLSAEYYPSKEALGNDVVTLLRDELLALRDAGCAFVQFDEPVLTEVAFAGPHATHTFMCAALSEKSSPEEELSFAVELINRVVAGVDGIKTGLHVCRGNWSRQENVLLQGAYDPLIPYFSRMQVQQLVLEYATERAGNVEVLGALPPDKEIGLGVCNPRSSELESCAFIVDKVRRLLQHRRPEQIYLNPDCGFGTFADRPVNSMEVAAQKLQRLHAAAQILRAEYA